MRKEEAFTQIKAKVTTKVNEVKATESMLTQLNQKIGSEPTSMLPSCFKAIFNISICIYILIIFIFKNFISIPNLIKSDPSDHPSQTVTAGKLSGCKMFCLSQQTASTQAENLVKTLANADPRRLSKVPEIQPNLHYKNLPRNLFVPSHRYSGLIRNSGNHLYHDSFIFNYLDSSR